MSAEVVLCTHNTTISASLDYCHKLTNPISINSHPFPVGIVSPTKPISRYDGPIFLPPQIYKLLSQDAMKALKAYNTEAISRFHQRKVQNTEIVETPEEDAPGPPVPKK